MIKTATENADGSEDFEVTGEKEEEDEELPLSAVGSIGQQYLDLKEMAYAPVGLNNKDKLRMRNNP